MMGVPEDPVEEVEPEEDPEYVLKKFMLTLSEALVVGWLAFRVGSWKYCLVSPVPDSSPGFLNEKFSILLFSLPNSDFIDSISLFLFSSGLSVGSSST